MTIVRPFSPPLFTYNPRRRSAVAAYNSFNDRQTLDQHDDEMQYAFTIQDTGVAKVQLTVPKKGQEDVASDDLTARLCCCGWVRYEKAEADVRVE